MLEAAYNDSAGITAEFNKNVLSVLNRELAADFDLDAFEHVAFWDDENLWVDIRLRSLARRVIQISSLDEVPFGRGRMWTDPHPFAREARRTYAEPAAFWSEWWTDPTRSCPSRCLTPAPELRGRCESATAVHVCGDRRRVRRGKAEGGGVPSPCSGTALGGDRRRDPEPPA